MTRVTHVASYTPEDVAGSTAGNGSTDCASAISTILGLGGKVRFRKGGVYKIASAVSVTPSRAPQIEFEDGAYIDCSSLATGADAITIAGTQGSGNALSSNASKGATAIASATTTGVVAGSVLRVYSNAQFDPVRTASKIGELVFVENVSGTTINLASELQNDYLTADSAAYRLITPLNGLVVENPCILGVEGGKYLTGIALRMCVKPRVSGGWIKKCSEIGLQLQDCLGGSVEDLFTEIFASTDNGYGLSIAGPCRDIRITGHTAHGNRHAITTNNSAVAGAEGIPRNIYYEDFAIDNTNTALDAVGGAAVDTHAAGDGFTVRNGVINNASGISINIEQPNVLIENVKIAGGGSHAISLFNFTSFDGNYTLRNIEVQGCTDAVRCFEASSSATGRVKSLLIDGLKVKDFIGQVLEFSSANATVDTVVETRSVDADATSATSGASFPIFQLTSAKEWRVSACRIKNLTAAGTGVQWNDVGAVIGDLPTVEFKTGTNSSGIAYQSTYASATTVGGTITGRVVATGTNTAKAFDLDAETRGLEIRKIESNANTLVNIAAGATYIPPRGYPYTTAGRPVVPNTKGIEIFDTTLNKPIWSDGAGGWKDATATAV